MTSHYSKITEVETWTAIGKKNNLRDMAILRTRTCRHWTFYFLSIIARFLKVAKQNKTWLAFTQMEKIRISYLVCQISH